MGWSKHCIKQQYKIKINHEHFMKTLGDLIEEASKEDERIYDNKNTYCEVVEVDDEEITLSGQYEAGVKTWYCRQTLESPEESEIEKPYIEDFVDVKGIIKENIDALLEGLKVEVIEREEDIDWDDEEYY